VLDRSYTDAELDAAIAALSDGGRLREAQDVVLRTAPALQRLLGQALAEGGWFGFGHEQAIREAAVTGDEAERIRLVRTLLAEETRLGMLVGVAVGFELARELERSGAPQAAAPAEGPPEATAYADGAPEDGAPTERGPQRHVDEAPNPNTDTGGR
jgi:hypothetical protein